MTLRGSSPAARPSVRSTRPVSRTRPSKSSTRTGVSVTGRQLASSGGKHSWNALHQVDGLAAQVGPDTLGEAAEPVRQRRVVVDQPGQRLVDELGWMGLTLPVEGELDRLVHQGAARRSGRPLEARAVPR